jgi:peptidyl-prolyl cis-trans isomerase D
VDLGDVSRLELDAAGEAVFGAGVGDVVGPLPSPLGPALFRVNGILPAQTTTLEEARDILRDDIALDRARRVIDAQVETLDDALAGGATLEQLAAESDMQLGQIDYNEMSGEEIAAYADFRAAAAALTLEDFPEIAGLDDGGLFAMRLDEVLPPRPEPFEDAFEAAKAALEDVRLEAALADYAETLRSALAEGQSFTDLGLTATIETDQTRDSFIPRTPPGFLPAIFAMETGAVEVIAEAGIVALVQLDAIKPPAEDARTQALSQRLQAALDQALAQDLFNVFTQDVGVRANPQINPQAVEAVNVNFQ